MGWKRLLPLISTYFLDFAGLFMVVPIFAPTFLDIKTPFLLPETSRFERTMIIGSLVSMYGVAQFIAAPILGELSDQFGRKKILSFGLFCLTIGYALGAISFMIYNLPLLYISRLLVGAASGNGSVLFAAASEISTDRTRATNIGYLTGAATVGVIVGPFLGSYLTEPLHVHWFSKAVPFWVMALLGVINLLLISYFFHDEQTYTRRKFNVFTGFKNIYEAFQNPLLRIILLAYFFFVLSSESIFVSLPIYVVEKFRVSPLFIGHLFIITSSLSALTSLFINPQLSQKWRSYQIYFFALILLIILYLSLFVPKHPEPLYVLFGLCGISMVLCWTHGNAMAAKIAGPHEQGKVLGVTQSLLSLAILFGPLVIGTLAAVHYNIALLFSPLSATLSLIFITKSWYDLTHKQT